MGANELLPQFLRAKIDKVVKFREDKTIVYQSVSDKNQQRTVQ